MSLPRWVSVDNQQEHREDDGTAKHGGCSEHPERGYQEQEQTEQPNAQPEGDRHAHD